MRAPRVLLSVALLTLSSIAFAQVLPCLPSASVYRKAVLDRARQIAADISGNRKAFQEERRALGKTFGQLPKPTLEMLATGNGKFLGPILDAAVRANIDPELLTAAMVQEGLDTIITSMDPSMPIDGFGTLGVDGFATDMAMLKKGGFLRKDFDGINFTKGFADAEGVYTKDATGQITMGGDYWRNEAGQVYRAFEFKNLAAAAEGMAAYLKYKQSLFLRDAKRLGLDVARMSSVDLAG